MYNVFTLKVTGIPEEKNALLKLFFKAGPTSREMVVILFTESAPLEWSLDSAKPVSTSYETDLLDIWVKYATTVEALVGEVKLSNLTERCNVAGIKQVNLFAGELAFLINVNY